MSRYNRKSPGHAIIYCTYQAYLKSCPEMLAQHLTVARKENFTLGIKLVRGAYLASDPRHLIHDTKAETDACYDGIAEAVLKKQYNSVLRPIPGEEGMRLPDVSLVLACHNLKSVRKAQDIRRKQAERGEEWIEMCYGQLQGMADEVSCELVQAARTSETSIRTSNIATRDTEKQQIKPDVDVPQAYKYLVWGTTGECMKYLLRRAQENSDAVQRTKEGRTAMIWELVRRGKKTLGIEL